MKTPLFTALALVLAAARVAAAADAPPLALEKKIALANVSGRIDHLAIDRKNHRLFVAELGNNTVDVIDLATGSAVHRIAQLRAPQGLGYLPEMGLLFVANAGDGAVQIFRDSDFSQVAKIDLKEDADNVRVLEGTHTVVVGYGSGALAVLDGETHGKISDIHLKEHPESFQIDPKVKRAYVNVPDAHEIAVVDLATGAQVAAWDQLPARANYPMALMADGAALAAVFRSPARLITFDTSNGSIKAQLPSCGDADDVFWDRRRDRLYVSCGEGKIDVYDAASTKPTPRAEISTASGARTGFYDPNTDRFYLAVRAGLGRQAEIWVYRPSGP